MTGGSDSPAERSAVALACAGAILLYSAGFLLWFSATPLGLAPVLDGREILELAVRMAAGNLPAEPFYRAPLYPALLALLLEAGVPPAELAFSARLLNGLLHLASSALVWRLARLLWQGTPAAALATLLYGLNPVALHFAADPLDITLAITLLLGGIERSLRGPRLCDDVAAGTAFALATLARPQLLPVVLAWWLWRLWPVRDRAALAHWLAGAVLPALLVFGAMGAVNQRVSGEFRVLPWQGAFNLWAANRPGANGRYFEQSAPLGAYEEGSNPARLDAERLYRERAPGAPDDIATTTRYWQQRLRAEIAAEPLVWLRLLVGKAWYLLNNFEQYNNKTYHLHKHATPWLARNPLCWSVLLGLAVYAGVAGWSRPGVRLVVMLAAAYAAGLLLSYVSDRFRLPLVALGAVLAGGSVSIARGARPATLALAALVTAASVVPPPVAEATRTYVQDFLLFARAALATGHPHVAERYADMALYERAGDAAALELGCVARFHQWLLGEQTTRELRAVAGSCAPIGATAPSARRIVALHDWRVGRDAQALVSLRALAAGGPERDTAWAALVMIDAAERAAAARACAPGGCPDPVLLALAVHGDARARAELERRLPRAALERHAAELVRTYTRAPAAPAPSPAERAQNMPER